MANNQLLASDNFSSGSLAAGWTAAYSSPLPVVVKPGAIYVMEDTANGVFAAALWEALSWPNNQVCEFTINAFTAVNAYSGITALMRFSSSAVTGYYLNVHATAVNIVVVTAGTQTILATSAAITISAGDVFTFSASGPVFSIFQNGKCILYCSDWTYTSGYTGIGIYLSGSDATSTIQVSSWRGYSAVQQDGVWSKQGSVMPGISADGQGGVQPSQIIYEGSSQLGFVGNVYKMWPFSWSPAKVYYMESQDGVNWTRKSGSVANYLNSSIYKNGSTYYMYAQDTYYDPISALTSSDGITWTLQNSSAVAASGGWDQAAVYFLTVIDIIAGTWYGLYGGLTTQSGVWSVGLATSTDGIHWTKYVGNPVISLQGGVDLAKKINGVYYIAVTGAQQGRGQGNDNDPTETVIYTSTDLIHWSLLHHSIHNSAVFESLNALTGQTFLIDVVDISGIAYAYYMGAPGDPGAYQVCLATGPSTYANILSQSEDGMPIGASDSFVRSPGGLGTNWTTPTGSSALTISSSGIVEATATGTQCAGAYTGMSFLANQWSEITVAAASDSGSIPQPFARLQTGATTGYTVLVTGAIGSADASVRLQKVTAGSSVGIGPTTKVTLSIGDKLRLSVIDGSDGFPVLSFYQNGFLILQYQDYGAPISSGSPGMSISETTALANTQISGWTGGNANVIPSYITIGGQQGGAFLIGI